MCNSIRISDHTGKKHLSYMFNLGKNISNITRDKKEFTRYYYPFSKMEELIQHILRHRQNKKRQYGESYAAAMEQMRQKNQHNKGFWSSAYLVTSAELRHKFDEAFTVRKDVTQ